MPELTQHAQDKALRAMFGGTLTLALTRGGQEIDDAGYQAKAIEMTAPLDMGESNTRIVTNSGDVRFGPWADDALDPVEGWELRDGTGAALVTGEYLSREHFARGQEAVIRGRTIILAVR